MGFVRWAYRLIIVFGVIGLFGGTVLAAPQATRISPINPDTPRQEFSMVSPELGAGTATFKITTSPDVADALSPELTLTLP